MVIPKKDKKYFFYTRISDGDYNNSLKDQKSILENLAEKNGHKIFRCIHETESGHDGDRKEFDEMIRLLFEDAKKDIDNREFAGIYVFKLDRLSRNYEDFNKIEKLLDLGYTITSATESLENTPTGRLLFRMLSSFAIYESEKLSNRQTYTRISNIVQQKFGSLGLKLIFGYKMGKEGIEINSKQANIVLKIYKKYVEFRNNKETDKKDVYELIWDDLKEDDKIEIRKYILKMEEEQEDEKQNKKDDKVKKKNSKKISYITYEKEIKFITGVLNNKSKLKYNGKFTNEVNVKDELIVNYINTKLKENSDKEIENKFILTGDNEIGGKIEFAYYKANLCIIDDELYNLVREDGRQYNKKQPDEEIYIGNYNDIIYCVDAKGKKRYLFAYERKNNAQYRVNRFLIEGSGSTAKFIDVGISQRKLDADLKKNGALKLVNFNSEVITYLQKKLIASLNEIKKNEKQKFTAQVMVYEREMKNRQYRIDNFEMIEDEEKDTLETLLKEKEYYSNYLNEVNEKIKNIDSEFDKKLWGFIDIFNKGENILLSRNQKKVNEALKVFFSGIELYPKTKKIKKVYFKNYIQKLIGN
nr:recombinase family protein [Candidatus Gracilibacteria bacterium]